MLSTCLPGINKVMLISSRHIVDPYSFMQVSGVSNLSGSLRL